MDDRGAADEQDFLAGIAGSIRIVSATARMLTALGFSLETVEFMNPKIVSPRWRSSGITRTPA